MSIYLKDLDGTAIEKWCVELDKCERRKMTNKETELMINAIFAEKKMEGDNDWENLLKGYNGVTILYNRVKYCHTYTMSKAVYVFLGSICDTPGMITEYANFIQYLCHKKHIKHIDMTTFAVQLFHGGFFRENDLQQAWCRQKVITDKGGSNNMLDYNYLMESIQKLG